MKGYSFNDIFHNMINSSLCRVLVNILRLLLNSSIIRHINIIIKRKNYKSINY